MVPDEEVIEMYEGSHVPLEQMSDFYGKVTRNYLFNSSSLSFSFSKRGLVALGS